MTESKNKYGRKVPFLEAVEGYIEKEIVPFHTPGHIQGRGVSEEFKAFFSKALKGDLAEVEYERGGHDYEAARKEAEEYLAALYGVARSFFLINGTTQGLQALFLAYFCDLGGKGKEILLPRNSHRSIVSGLILSGAKPRWVYPKIDHRWNLATVCDTRKWQKASEGVDGVFHLYPNYYGICQDLGRQIVPGVPNLVDEAHGPHFTFSKRLPETAIKFNINASVQSAHKILASLTQSSWLHIKESKDILRIQRALALIESTSPNFLLWASLDSARKQEEKDPTRWDKALDEVINLRKELKEIKGLEIFYPDAEDPDIIGCDPFKLVVSAENSGLNGFEFRDELRKRKVMPELAEPNFVLFIVTPSHTKEDLQHLKRACTDIAEMRSKADALTVNRKRSEVYPKLRALLTPREAFYRDHRKIKLNEADGLVCAETVIPYPPGIPLVMPGEVLSKEVLELIDYYRALGWHLRGLADQTARYIRIID